MYDNSGGSGYKGVYVSIADDRCEVVYVDYIRIPVLTIMHRYRECEPTFVDLHTRPSRYGCILNWRMHG